MMGKQKGAFFQKSYQQGIGCDPVVLCEVVVIFSLKIKLFQLWCKMNDTITQKGVL